MRVDTVYFEDVSTDHTSSVIEYVRRFLDAGPSVRSIVVASPTGTTGLRFAKAFPDRRVVVVSHQCGFSHPDVNELSDEKRTEIERSGARVLTATHAFAGVARGIRKALGTWTEPELLALAYRTLGQGTKVCAEISMMAADAGLVSVSEDIVAVGGTGRGADTAWVIRPAYTSSFAELKMRACICKPLEF
ncbi:MAG: pyruvate kinase alpha/beta domain-containing protein [Candidatus Thorarchaeota archaeon]